MLEVLAASAARIRSNLMALAASRHRAQDSLQQIVGLPQNAVVETERLLDHHITLVILEGPDEDRLAGLEVRDGGGYGLPRRLGSAGSEGGAFHHVLVVSAFVDVGQLLSPGDQGGIAGIDRAPFQLGARNKALGGERALIGIMAAGLDPAGLGTLDHHLRAVDMTSDDV